MKRKITKAARGDRTAGFNERSLFPFDLQTMRFAFPEGYEWFNRELQLIGGPRPDIAEPDPGNREHWRLRLEFGMHEVQWFGGQWVMKYYDRMEEKENGWYAVHHGSAVRLPQSFDEWPARYSYLKHPKHIKAPAKIFLDHGKPYFYIAQHVSANLARVGFEKLQYRYDGLDRFKLLEDVDDGVYFPVLRLRSETDEFEEPSESHLEIARGWIRDLEASTADLGDLDGEVPAETLEQLTAQWHRAVDEESLRLEQHHDGAILEKLQKFVDSTRRVVFS